jgi:hypothetical protein
VDAPVVVLVPFQVNMTNTRILKAAYQVAGRGRLDCKLIMADS